jgi:hypothetical protein
VRVRHAFATSTAFVLLMSVPRAALACPVCFGQNDSPLSTAVAFGVMVMLGVVVLVLGGFASFIVHLRRRARLAADFTTSAEPPGPGGVTAYSPTNPQEGTARC